MTRASYQVPTALRAAVSSDDAGAVGPPCIHSHRVSALPTHRLPCWYICVPGRVVRVMPVGNLLAPRHRRRVPRLWGGLSYGGSRGRHLMLIVVSWEHTHTHTHTHTHQHPPPPISTLAPCEISSADEHRHHSPPHNSSATVGLIPQASRSTARHV